MGSPESLDGHTWSRDWWHTPGGGGKRAGLSLCREMLCQEIYAGRPVHWIDGGMSLDPSALIRPLSDRGRTPSSLSLLRTCRAFTAHQMHELVSRLERDLLVFEDGGTFVWSS